MLIRRHDPNARIVFVTVHAESMLIEAGLEAGALGYVLKDAAGDDLVAAIRAALGGRQYVSRELRGHEGLIAAGPFIVEGGDFLMRRLTMFVLACGLIAVARRSGPGAIERKPYPR